MRITCPWCGERYLGDFTYQGDATVERPDINGECSDEEWHAYVYLRDNPKGWHDEIWHHTNGCRKHFKVRRNVITHEIASTAPMDGTLSGGDK